MTEAGGAEVGTGAPVVVSDAGAVGDAVAEHIVAALSAARAAGRPPVIGWPVGRTPRPVVTALGRLAREGRVRFDDVHVILMDDYVEPTAGGLRRVATELPYSCRGTALRELVAPLDVAAPAGRGLRPETLHSPDPGDPGAFETLIADLGGIDLFVVALGTSDGHVALNPPGSPRASRTRVVEIAASTRSDNVLSFGLGQVDQVPHLGVTVGLATIAEARRLVVVAHGSGKRDIVERLVRGTGFESELPMTIVRDHPAATLICDVACAPRGTSSQAVPSPGPAGAAR